MDLSIIIPSFNTKALLSRCLHSVEDSMQGSGIHYEVIVVDNASGDGTKELLNKKFTRVEKIFSSKNLGYGKSNNIGIKKSKGQYILLLNSDIKALKNAIPKLYEFALSHPASFAGGKLLNEDGSPQSSCGPEFSVPVVFAMLFLKGDTLGVTRYSPDTVTPVAWVSGACLIAKRDVFTTVGMFDENIFMYMDEIDFLYQARARGYTTLFYPDACFIHTGAASSKDRREPVVNIYRGLQYFYAKNRSAPEQLVLKMMLLVKAYVGMALGRLVGDAKMVTTYEQARRLFV